MDPEPRSAAGAALPSKAETRQDPPRLAEAAQPPGKDGGGTGGRGGSAAGPPPPSPVRILLVILAGLGLVLGENKATGYP